MEAYSNRSRSADSGLGRWLAYLSGALYVGSGLVLLYIYTKAEELRVPDLEISHSNPLDRGEGVIAGLLILAGLMIIYGTWKKGRNAGIIQLLGGVIAIPVIFISFFSPAGLVLVPVFLIGIYATIRGLKIVLDYDSED